MHIARRIVLGAALLLGACVGDDLTRTGTWQPTGLNDANLRAMLANPADAARGQATEDERGQPGARAARALDAGRRAPLPESNLSRVGRAAVPATTGPAAGGGDAR